MVKLSCLMLNLIYLLVTIAEALLNSDKLHHKGPNHLSNDIANYLV